MNTQSRWLAENPLPHFPAFAKNHVTDVAIVGGGMTGLSVAYLLAKSGIPVTLLERTRLGSGDTAHTSAHLTYVTDSRLTQLINTFGRDHARAVWDAGNAAINTIESNIAEEKIKCEFTRVPGFLHLPVDSEPAAKETENLKAEALLAAELSFDASYIDSAPLVRRPAIVFADQAIFRPLQYLAGLARAVQHLGGHIFENSEATDFETEKSSTKITANNKTLTCKYLIIATHVPLLGKNNLLSGTLFQSKITGYTSYVLGAKLPHHTAAPSCFWNTNDPYDYIRLDRQPDHDYILYGGEDHKTGQESDTESRYARVEKKLRALFPKAKLDKKWSGQVIQTNDGLPFIGEATPGQFIATGYVGNGITFGTLAGIMARDQLLNHKNPWTQLFDPHRKPLSSAWDYLKENADYPYYLLRDRLKSAQAGTPESLARGEGKILSIAGQKSACHRDAHGKLHTVSATCTHMGCLVHWNPAEKTWDCPCHGARYKPTGEVIAGPAETPLKPL